MSKISKIIIWLLIILFFSSCGFLLCRNHWVYLNRQAIILDRSNEEYKKLWPYNKMMFYVWIWDIEKMKYEEIK